jgi:hypothetical protein
MRTHENKDEENSINLQKMTKCVIVIAEGLPLGPTVNIASVLATTLGNRLGSLMGPDVFDASGFGHPGFTRLPLPILMADPEAIKAVRFQAASCSDVFVADFTETAQQARTYEDYIQQLATRSSEDLVYLGIMLYGSKKTINRLAGNFRLLRETSAIV